ncbi:hypothetical protein [Enterobacter bugandensis]|uniref:hypothetical protein n=1 Tax=Enterobacter bugandensis TaxID=881260 RepID=UPI0029D8D669|nr:hypothetical protein [Enterobacter bugandensis]MDX7624544.1 hypothetical protein [Enterobacter bugandensis]
MNGRFAKEQEITIISLSVTTFLLAIIWIFQEVYDFWVHFSLEPVVTTFASFIPIVTLFWPFKPKYKSARKCGKLIIPMYNTDKIEIGIGDYQFIPTLSHASMNSQHFYVGDPSLDGSAIINDANYFHEVKNASGYVLTKKTKTPNINDLIVVKNRYNKHALIKILAIKESTSNVKGIEVEIEYAINSTGGVNFS